MWTCGRRSGMRASTAGRGASSPIPRVSAGRSWPISTSTGPAWRTATMAGASGPRLPMSRRSAGYSNTPRGRARGPPTACRNRRGSAAGCAGCSAQGGPATSNRGTTDTLRRKRHGSTTSVRPPRTTMGAKRSDRAYRPHAVAGSAPVGHPARVCRGHAYAGARLLTPAASALASANASGIPSAMRSAASAHTSAMRRA